MFSVSTLWITAKHTDTNACSRSAASGHAGSRKLFDQQLADQASGIRLRGDRFSSHLPPITSLLQACFWGCWISLSGCSDSSSKSVSPPPTQDSGTLDSGALDSGSTDLLDEDGDGWPSWEAVTDPSLADCDDQDPLVTPLTERLIGEGSFLRGHDNEKYSSPAQSIYLSHYCIDVFEITNADFLPLLEYRKEEGAPNTNEEGQTLFDFEDADDEFPERILETDLGYSIQPGYETHPVNEVYRWAGIYYCAWKGKRLPTEAEWEKAARGTDGRIFPWGDDDPDCSLSNYWPRGENNQPASPCIGDTTPVGSYPSGISVYGIHDMAGNVSEWVSDWFQEDYYENAPETDPTGPDSGWVVDEEHPEGFEATTARGGSHGSGKGSLKSHHRTPEPTDATSNGLGFRCVRDLE